jgi:hypothetical protein
MSSPAVPQFGEPFVTPWNELKEFLLRECDDDEAALWFIISELRRHLGIEDGAEIRRATLQMVRELLETGRVVAGLYAPPDSGLPAWRIVGWSGSVDDILARIEEEWDKLGREPDPGEVVVLQAKD